jgi:methionyl-tRNA synthetase
MIPAHGIYWPIMLHALGFPDEQMPKLLVHGWWNISGTKMSKSLGNVVDPDELADKYGVEALRYYLMSDIATGSDADFSEERLIMRYNTNLANDLGNLLNRTLAMIERYRARKVTQVQLEVLGLRPFVISVYAEIHSYKESMDGGAPKYPSLEPLQTEGVVQAVRVIAFHCNRFIDDVAPWKLAKSKSDENALRLDAVLYGLADVLRIIAILISPVLPKAAHGIFDQLNWKMEPQLSGKEERFSLKDARWGMLPDGHIVGKPTPLFPRIDTA